MIKECVKAGSQLEPSCAAHVAWWLDAVTLLCGCSHWERCHRAVIRQVSRHTVTAAVEDSTLWFREEEEQSVLTLAISD